MTQAGWYSDPWGRAPLRWWNGAEWTSDTTGPLPDPWPIESASEPVVRSPLARLLSMGDRIVVIDVETTGLHNSDRVVEIAVVTLDSVRCWRPRRTATPWPERPVAGGGRSGDRRRRAEPVSCALSTRVLGVLKRSGTLM